MISHSRVPILSAEDNSDEDENDSTVTYEHIREHGSEVVKLARRPDGGDVWLLNVVCGELVQCLCEVSESPISTDGVQIS